MDRLDDAKAVICNLWGSSEVDRAIEEFQSVIKNDGTDLESKWSELLEEPHLRGCIKVVFGCDIVFSYYWSCDDFVRPMNGHTS